MERPLGADLPLKAALDAHTLFEAQLALEFCIGPDDCRKFVIRIRCHSATSQLGLFAVPIPIGPATRRAASITFCGANSTAPPILTKGVGDTKTSQRLRGRAVGSSSGS